MQQYFCDLASREAKEIAPGVQIRTFWGEKMLASIVDLDANAAVLPHHHHHEQMGTVLSGELEMSIGEETRRLQAGDTYIIPGGVEHSAKTGDIPARVLDVFNPIREEYQY